MRRGFQSGPHSYTEVTHQSFGSRIGGSLCGVCVGWLLLVAAPLVLWFNEQNAVAVAQELYSLRSVVVPLGVDPSHAQLVSQAGKPVHFTGTVSGGSITDNVGPFTLTADAVKLQRTSSMYQWKETSRSHTKKNVGGSSTTETTYDYHTHWSSSFESSSGFRLPGHDNPQPALPLGTQTKLAEGIRIGAAKPSMEVLDALPVRSLWVEEQMLSGTGRQVQAAGGSVYLGDRPDVPQVGDIRVAYASFPADSDASVVAIVQHDGTITGAPGSVLPLVSGGTESAEALIAARETANTVLMWVLRLVGFVLMYFGFAICIEPLNTVSDVIPFIGSIVRWVTGTAVFFVAVAATLVVVAVAWLFARPALSMALLCIAASAIFFTRTTKPRRE